MRVVVSDQATMTDGGSTGSTNGELAFLTAAVPPLLGARRVRGTGCGSGGCPGHRRAAAAGASPRRLGAFPAGSSGRAGPAGRR